RTHRNAQHSDAKQVQPRHGAAAREEHKGKWQRRTNCQRELVRVLQNPAITYAPRNRICAEKTHVLTRIFGAGFCAVAKTRLALVAGPAVGLHYPIITDAFWIQNDASLRGKTLVNADERQKQIDGKHAGRNNLEGLERLYAL